MKLILYEFASIRDIYSNEMVVIKEPTHYIIQYKNNNNKKQKIMLDITYPIDYPSESPPIYTISTSFMKKLSNRSKIEDKFKSIWSENIGQCTMFEWISEFQEYSSLVFEK